jgi:hypothetical protein
MPGATVVSLESFEQTSFWRIARGTDLTPRKGSGAAVTTSTTSRADTDARCVEGSSYRLSELTLTGVRNKAEQRCIRKVGSTSGPSPALDLRPILNKSRRSDSSFEKSALEKFRAPRRLAQSLASLRVSKAQPLPKCNSIRIQFAREVPRRSGIHLLEAFQDWGHKEGRAGLRWSSKARGQTLILFAFLIAAICELDQIECPSTKCALHNHAKVIELRGRSKLCRYFQGPGCGKANDITRMQRPGISSENLCFKSSSSRCRGPWPLLPTKLPRRSLARYVRTIRHPLMASSSFFLPRPVN